MQYNFLAYRNLQYESGEVEVLVSCLMLYLFTNTVVNKTAMNIQQCGIVVSVIRHLNEVTLCRAC